MKIFIKNKDPFNYYSIGAGTTHRVNGIAIQRGKFTETVYSNYEPKRKRSRRSFQLPSLSSGEEYLARKRIGPGQLQCPDNEEKHFLFGNQERMRLTWILSRKEDINYIVSSWTGFNILIRNEMPILHSNIQYLTSVDSPATEMSTVITVLDRCLKIKEQLRLKYIVCVFDQAIYCKAMELKSRYPDKYKDCVVMLVIFHMIMMYLGIIGKTFSDAGLKDLVVQSYVVATGSAEKALSVKMCNRSVRAHKLVYEALCRCLLNRMEDNNTEESELASTISDIQDKVNKFSEDITQISHDEFIESDCFEQFNNAVIDYKQYLESTSDLAKFWLSYLSMVELLLNTLYATPTGDWDLLLECVRDIARYALAYDNYNYPRYLTPWLSDMINLETSHPDVYHEFKRGNF